MKFICGACIEIIAFKLILFKVQCNIDITDIMQ